MIDDQITARLYVFIRENIKGGCKKFSIGDKCECPLCDLDRLLDASNQNTAMNYSELIARLRGITGTLKSRAWKTIQEAANALQAMERVPMTEQPRLTVRVQSFPESNGKRNWAALLVRVEEWGGLVGSCGGITIDRGELWNRVAYEAERAKFLIGERDTEPFILDYGDDITTPEQWAGEKDRIKRKATKAHHGITPPESI